MSSIEVLVVRTGTANTASVLAALTRLEASARLVDPERAAAAQLHDAPLVVLPGVGAFGPAMACLEGVAARALSERIAAGRATLAVCLGLQLLCAASEESPGVRGLGVLPVEVTRFADDVRVPQLGWSKIAAEPDCELLASGYAYFANSYRLEQCPPGWRAAWADHGGRYVAALERGAVLACQFHPELSGAWGRALLSRWLERARAEVS